MKNNMEKLLKLKSKQEQIFSCIAGILGGISSPVRIKLIHFLSQEDLSVEVLAQKMDQSVANTSMHLRKMLNENLVNVEALGQRRVYSLNKAVLKFWESIQDFSCELDDSLSLNVETIYDDINWDLDLDQTIDILKTKEIVLLDVRPIDETVSKPLSRFDIKYINIPSSDIEKISQLIPKNKKILVLCRGRFCALSANTTSELRKIGYEAYRFTESWFSLEQAIIRNGEKND